MNCSCASSQRTSGAARFFTKNSRRYVKTYRRKGLAKEQRLLLDGAERIGAFGGAGLTAELFALVWLSSLKAPRSVAAVRSGCAGKGVSEVSIVTGNPAPISLALPARSVNCAK